MYRPATEPEVGHIGDLKPVKVNSRAVPVSEMHQPKKVMEQLPSWPGVSDGESNKDSLVAPVADAVI